MTRRVVAMLVPVAALLVLLGCSGSGERPVDLGGSGSKARPAALRMPPTEQKARLVLRAWDERRASAFAAGSVGRLRSLYVDGAAAGVADVRLLRTYVDRGLVVEGMRMQVLALEVLGSTGSRLRLRVTDRLVGARARGPAGVVPLPRDSPTTRVVTLRAVAGTWRVASVR